MVCSGLATVEWAQAVREGRGAKLGLRPGGDRRKNRQMVAETDQQLGYGLEGYGEAGYLCGVERGSK